jgi:hypothetical protein
VRSEVSSGFIKVAFNGSEAVANDIAVLLKTIFDLETKKQIPALTRGPGQ